MIISTPASNAYSQALLGAAEKSGKAEAIAEQADSLHRLLMENRRVRTFFEAPNIPRDDKESFIQKAFGKQFHELLVNFCRLLVRRGRLDILVPALANFVDSFKRSQDVFPAQVTTAVPLDDADRSRMKEALEKYTGHTLEIRWHVASGLLGGVRFQSGDLLIDTTLRANLDRLRSKLLKTKVY